jgi:hypothetical protein
MQLPVAFCYVISVRIQRMNASRLGAGPGEAGTMRPLGWGCLLERALSDGRLVRVGRAAVSPEETYAR